MLKVGGRRLRRCEPPKLLPDSVHGEVAADVDGNMGPIYMVARLQRQETLTRQISAQDSTQNINVIPRTSSQAQ
jgi:hypothetical protein